MGCSSRVVIAVPVFCFAVVQYPAFAQDRSVGPKGLPHAPAAAEVASVIETQCGPFDDSQHVELYEQSGAKPERSFVDMEQRSTIQLQWRSDLASLFNRPGDSPGNVSGQRWCSGTLISPTMVLTAAHCFEVQTSGWKTPRRGPAGTPLPPPELAPLMMANFNYQVDGSIPDVDPNNPASYRKPAIFAVKRLVEYGFSPERGNLDYAIVELENDAAGRNPGDVFAIANYDARDEGLTTATFLTIVQHPAGSPKKVDAGPLASATTDSIFYDDLDTLGGSSGAGIVNQNGALIGVHTNGGCSAMGGGANRGTALKAVREVSGIIR